MSTYAVIGGDDFAKIARKVYGTEEKASLISLANPGVFEPLNAGIEVTVPVDPSAPKDVTPVVAAESIDEVALSIEGERFRFWDSLSITRSIDTFSAVNFGAPFNEDDPAFRATFRPFSYKDVDVTLGGEQLFAGTMIAPMPVLGVAKRTVSVSAYSLPAVMNDCNIPASAFPLEFNGLGLRDIAVKVSSYFGLAVEFEGDQGPVFERVAADPSKKAFDFLSGLARQRNFIISSTVEGKLLFRQSVAAGNPVARLVQGSAPVESITPQFSPQEYYSHITGLQPALIGVGGAQYTVENTRLRGVVRPLTFRASDTEAGNLKAAVEAKAGRMFANAVSYNVSVATWRDRLGRLWSDNTTITLTAPGVMIYNEYEFIIRNVTLSAEGSRRSAVLNVVLPGAFSGQVPEAMPWDE